MPSLPSAGGARQPGAVPHAPLVPAVPCSATCAFRNLCLNASTLEFEYYIDPKLPGEAQWMGAAGLGAVAGQPASQLAARADLPLPLPVPQTPRCCTRQLASRCTNSQTALWTQVGWPRLLGRLQAEVAGSSCRSHADPALRRPAWLQAPGCHAACSLRPPASLPAPTPLPRL